MSGTPESDVVIAGSGLAASLIAWRLAEARPDVSVTLLERATAPCGDHTWSFHAPDLSDAASDWIAPLVEHRWERQRVVFPGHARDLRAGYRSLTSASVRRGLARVGNRVRIETQAQVVALDPGGATLADGRRFEAPLVIDARGFRPSPHIALGYQKFVGLELEVDAGHGETAPVIMDATVAQDDGYRFVYTLPFSPTHILVEDTHYSDDDALDRETLLAAARDYAADKGWRGEEVRVEQGVLPIALATDAEAFWDAMPRDAVPVGMRAGLFQHITGYSLPLAVEVAELIAAAPVLETAPVFDAVRDYALALDRRQAFFRLLNRMLFRGCAPERRYRLLERFYKMPEPLIERFYAARTTKRDALRVVTGKPPIPLTTAFGCLSERKVLRNAA